MSSKSGYLKSLYCTSEKPVDQPSGNTFSCALEDPDDDDSSCQAVRETCVPVDDNVDTDRKCLISS